MVGFGTFCLFASNTPIQENRVCGQKLIENTRFKYQKWLSYSGLVSGQILRAEMGRRVRDFNLRFQAAADLASGDAEKIGEAKFSAAQRRLNNYQEYSTPNNIIRLNK